MKTVTFKIDEAFLEELDSLSGRLKESRSTIIKKALEFYIDNYDGLIARSRYEAPEDGEWVVHEELLKDYGLL